MPVVLQDCTMSFETSDWYCTNRPSINTPIQIPAFITADNIASAKLSIVYAPQSNVQPHNGQILFNGTQVGSYANEIPTGQFSFDIPASTWQNSIAGNAVQSVQMNTQHPNPGHYVSATGYHLDVSISQATTYVCASSQTSAQQVVQQQYACHTVAVQNPFLVIRDEANAFSASPSSAGNAGGAGPTESSCGVSCKGQDQGNGRDPINTNNRAVSITLSDLSFPTTAGELILQGEYSSGPPGTYTESLGYGWTFNHEAKLISPTDPGGTTGFLTFQSATGNQYLFKIEANGSYTPEPGMVASLIKSSTDYLLTDSKQHTYRFN